MLIGNPNSAAYDGISQILAANNFNFQALPNFINFHDDKVLESIFKPYNYGEQISSGSCGPAFVCVYAGQSSKHLDVKEGNYPNDGFDLRCMTGDQTKGSMDVTVPPDFTDSEAAKYEDPIGTFTVKYSQQNQSIFKDINLDQSEFSETDESLQVQDEISQKGSENNRSIVGQNIYNVYAVRSYTAQIEMMGNAMIQPMMYFQLDNIPMFHGAYLITKVSHSIRPNSMSTNFSGTRIRYPETPLISAYEVYMDLLETLDLSEAGTAGGTSGSGAVDGEFEPIIATLIDNGVSNAYIDKGKTYGNVTTKDVDMKDTGFSISSSGRYMIAEASVALSKMLKAWSKWMRDNGFQANSNGKYGNIGSLYRGYASQVSLASGQKTAAKAGTSYHGWGVAVDMSWVNKEGKMLQFNYTQGSAKKDFDYTYNPAVEWLYNNSYVYGFINPLWARNGGSYDEVWHWEYHGTSAKCILNKSPNVFGKAIDMSKNYDSVVKNPKTPDGKEAVYTGCDARYIKRAGDGIEKNTLITKPEQAANQVKTKNFLKGKGLTKEQAAGIMGNMQQESTFNPGALNKKDKNGYASFGLIQWNEKYYKRKDVGSTLDEQLNFMLTMSTYTKFIKLAEPKTSVEEAAYQFANLVEVCDKCNKSYDTYKSSYQYVRTQFANDMFSRFNDKKDTLAW